MHAHLYNSKKTWAGFLLAECIVSAVTTAATDIGYKLRPNKKRSLFVLRSGVQAVMSHSIITVTSVHNMCQQ